MIKESASDLIPGYICGGYLEYFENNHTDLGETRVSPRFRQEERPVDRYALRQVQIEKRELSRALLRRALKPRK